MTDVILVLNAGSSSIKFAIYPIEAEASAVILGKVAGIGRAPVFTAHGGDGETLDNVDFTGLDGAASHEAIIAMLLNWLRQHLGDATLVSVGHRVVHGGRNFTKPTLIDTSVLHALEQLIPLAPLHQPHNLAAISAVAKWKANLPQVACFDTSFHQTQDRLAQLFALPRDLTDEGVIRYGFHGLSYDYIASILPAHLGERAKGRVVVAHLGNGASMCAMKNHQSVATSMGFTALDGLMMGSRCGALDAGVILYLMQHKGMSAAEVEHLLYRESGLLGVSGISNNMQVLEGSDSAHAREAIDLYCYRAATVLSGLVSTIGGLDALVFTAGIGENSSHIRNLICQRLSWLGIDLAESANATNATKISSATSRVDVLVIPTDEEVIIARATRNFVG
jgi:acetate kinase